MDVRDRMQHLGRRALKEPEDLTIPYGAQTSECHKPISMVPVKVQKHGWGEGRLPIPALADVVTRDDLMARQHQKYAEAAQQRAKAAARAAEAAKLIKAEMQQPQQQLDTAKARSRAARQFSMEVERKNAEKLRKSAPNTPTKPAEASTAVLVKQASQQRFSKQPTVERHILLRRPDCVPPPSEPEQAAAEGSAAIQEATAAAAAAVSRAATLIEHLAETVTDADEGGLSENTVLQVEGNSRSVLISDAISDPISSGLQQQTTEIQQQPQQQQQRQGQPQLHEEPTGLSAVLAAAVTTQQSLQELSVQVSAFSVTAEAAGTNPAQQSSRTPNPSVVDTTASAVAAASAADVSAASPSTASTQLAEAAAAAAAAVAAAEAAVAVAASTEPVSTTLPPSAAAAAGSRSSFNSPSRQRPVSSSEASSRLLAFARGPDLLQQQSTGSQPLTPVRQQQQQQGSCRLGLGGSPGRFEAAAHCTAGVTNALGSCNGLLHWSPVPPPTQVLKPIMVKQITPPAVSPVHAVKAQPQAVYHIQQEQRHQVRLKARPPWQGVMDSAAAAHKQPAAAGVGRSLFGAGAGAGQQSGVTELEKLGSSTGSSTSQQAQQQLMLPALCSCGHQTSPLDPAYPARCCSNCPLHNNPEGWRRLVIGLGMLDGCSVIAV